MKAAYLTLNGSRTPDTTPGSYLQATVWNAIEDIGIHSIKFVLDFVTFLYRCVISIIDVSSILTTCVFNIFGLLLAYELMTYISMGIFT
jgi:hypothetical protein